jgi:hypothetical protein
MLTKSKRSNINHFQGRSSNLFFTKSCALIIVLFTLFGCGGGSSNSGGGVAAPASNVGGGYTLKASGGTLNDGSGAKGLVVLATLRDSAGNGPSAPWTLSITGPGLGAPITVSYDDGSPASYMTWWWENCSPVSGVYTATATNGGTTLAYQFSLSSTSDLTQPALNKTSNTISWSEIAGAGSYYYRVTDGTGNDVITPGYLSADPLQTTYSFDLPYLADGSYLVEVYAQTTDRIALQNDAAPSPALAPQENMSLGAIDLVQGGGYSLSAEGGVLYEGQYPAGVDNYGLVIWTSILTAPTDSTSVSTPPAGDWTITVNGPNISNSAPITFTYPRTDSQYAYWDFGTVPAPGTYTVTATPAAGGAPLSQTFTIPAPTEQLPVSTVTASATTGGGATASWTAVTGANSYYVNVWTDVNGVYTEIAGNWVASTAATIPNGTLTNGVSYDVYVTACQLDMTDTTTVPPSAPGAQVNMSDTTFTYTTIIAK